MIVSEAIKLLKATELKQLGVKDDFSAILGYLNFGILELYKRFVLWEAEAIVTIVDGVLTYSLDGVDGNVAIDISDNDVLMIESIYLNSTDANIDDTRLVLNNEKDKTSIQTPQFHQIKIITPLLDTTPYILGDTLTVQYRAAAKFLTGEKDTIPLPQQFLEALFIYVGFKGQSSVKAGEKEENNTHYKRFQASCDRISLEGIFVQKDLESTKFEDRGFV